MATTAPCRNGGSLTLRWSKWCGGTANASSTRRVGVRYWSSDGNRRKRSTNSSSRKGVAMLSDIQNLDRSGRPEFRFRLNGEIMPEIFVQRAMVDGEPVGQWEIEVDVDG